MKTHFAFGKNGIDVEVPEGFDCQVVRSRAARALNDVYRHERSEPGSFAVMFLGVLDIASHSVAFVNAGLASAYVVRGGEPSALDASGLVIGRHP